ncbi:MAG: hypothetical protein M1837_002061 [Sclerophora amabilis]|nr:MAG: hypothetical protein M1837_002061 [Sclerophora amabilis]
MRMRAVGPLCRLPRLPKNTSSRELGKPLVHRAPFGDEGEELQSCWCLLDVYTDYCAPTEEHQLKRATREQEKSPHQLQTAFEIDTGALLADILQLAPRPDWMGDAARCSSSTLSPRRGQQLSGSDELIEFSITSREDAPEAFLAVDPFSIRSTVVVGAAYHGSACRI